MTTIQIDDQVAEALRALARARGISISELLGVFVAASAQQMLPVEEFDSELDQVAFRGPSLSDDFFRADKYTEHD